MMKLLAPAMLLMAALAITPQAKGQGNDPAAGPAEFLPADGWLGKWSGTSSYSQTDQVWDWTFEVLRPCDSYGIRFGRLGPETTEILHISPTELEFLLHDRLGTHLTIVRQGNDVYTGTVRQPNNANLPQGRVDGRRIEAAAAEPAARRECADAEPQGALTVELSPLEAGDGAREGRTGEAMQGYLSVTNNGKARVYAPELEVTLTGEAVSPHLQLQVQSLWKHESAEADFFEITCDVAGATVRCPVGYGDRVEKGRTYLEPGETRDFIVEFTAYEPGVLTLTATATAEGSGKLEANASRSTTFLGPILGLRLVSTSPPPYGYSDNPRLPLHDGKEITLRYAILASARGGGAREVTLDFFARLGEVVSVATAAGQRLACSRPKTTDLQTASCSLAGLAAGQQVEVDAVLRYDHRVVLETTVSAGESHRAHSYETWTDLDPEVTVGFAPPPSTKIAAGQRIAGNFDIANRGRDSVSGGVLRLWVENRGLQDFKIDSVDGCASVSPADYGLDCRLRPFAKGALAEVSVVTTPLPAGSEGRDVGLAWALTVPRHKFDTPSTANEEGYAQYRVAQRVADLFVSQYIPEEDIEPGVTQLTQLEIGNKGTGPAEKVALSLRFTGVDEAGVPVADGPRLQRAAIVLDEPAEAGGSIEVLCKLAGASANCSLDRLAPRQGAALMFQWDSGDLHAGAYSYEVTLDAGEGERDNPPLLRDNSLKDGAKIVAKGESYVDLRLFTSQRHEEVRAKDPQTFAFWVANEGTIAQEAVVLKFILEVETRRPEAARLRFLKDVHAIIPALDGEGGVRKVACVRVASTASCALGRLESEDLAQVFVRWHPFGQARSYRYEAYVGEGIGEAALGKLGDNTLIIEDFIAEPATVWAR